MKAATHIGCAEFIYLVLLTTAGIALTALNALAVALGAILPDVDNGASFAGRVAPPLTRILERRFGHRTLTHSIPFLACLAILSLPAMIAGCEPVTCALVAYASHPFLDTCTVGGVRLFYPFTGVRCVFPFDGNAPLRFRVETGSGLDRALGVLLFAACLPAWYVANQGYERFIRVVQHSIEAAVRDYEAYARSGTVFARMVAHDQLGGVPLNGRFPVVGALDAHTLVFTGPDGRLHSVGRGFESEYAAESIVCEKGAPARVSVRTLDMSFRRLSSLASYADSSGETYFLGDITCAVELHIPARARRFDPVTGSGKRLRLTFASGNDMRDLGLDSVIAISGTVIARTVGGMETPGEQLPRRTHLPGGVLVTVSVGPGEVLDIRKVTGDTLREGDTLALRTVRTFIDEQMALNAQRRQSVTSRDNAALRDIDRAIAAAARAAGDDSLGYRDASELVARGFSAPASLRRAEMKWEKSRRALAKLLASRTAVGARAEEELARLGLSALQLRARADQRAARSGVLSPCDGMLFDVRRETLGGQERVVFFIRRKTP